jgi:hypothetical protein
LPGPPATLNLVVGIVIQNRILLGHPPVRRFLPMAKHHIEDLAAHVLSELSHKDETPPSLETLEMLFETMYFASLKTEEHQAIACRVAFIRRDNPDPKPPELKVASRWKSFPLEQDLEFNVRNLVKLSTAVDPWTCEYGD